MNLKKFFLAISIIAVTLMATGCSFNKKMTKEDVITIIENTNKIDKYNSKFQLNYAVDDTSIIANGDINVDVKNNLLSGKIKVNYNDKIFEMPIIMKDNKIYLKDNNNKLFYINCPINNLNSVFSEIDKKSINFINIQNKEAKNIDFYRYTVKPNKKFNSFVKILGKIFYQKDTVDIKDISSLEIQTGIDKENNYATVKNINFNEVLEHNLVSDTSVIGVARLNIEISTLKEEVVIENVNNCQELININDLIDTYLTEDLQ